MMRMASEPVTRDAVITYQRSYCILRIYLTVKNESLITQFDIEYSDILNILIRNMVQKSISPALSL